jgi:Tol biopolymer transport system component/tetratricopeptide (TPR) repeat protein
MRSGEDVARGGAQRANSGVMKYSTLSPQDAPSEQMPEPRGRGPHWSVLAMIAAVLLVGLGGLVLAGLLGMRDGLEQRRQQQATAVAEHLARGMAYLANDERELARAEFAQVLLLQPEHEEALAQLSALEQQEAIVRSATLPVSPLATPTPIQTPQPGADTPGALEVLLADAGQSLEQRQWEEAILRLQQLQALAPDYEPQTVQTMLFQSHVGQAEQLTDSNHLEAALRSLDQALALRPDDAQVQEHRELLALYVQTVGAWGANWTETITALSDLYERRPDYRDVKDKLFAAHRTYGDTLARKELWCEAASQYAAALEIDSDSETAQVGEQADYLCRTATPTPVVSPTTVVTASIPSATAEVVALPTAVALPMGQLAYAARNQDGSQSEIWLLPASGQPRLLTTQASQPALSPDGAWLACRSERNDMLGLILVSVESGEWQRLTQYVEDGNPSWAPDGKRIAFASDREGDRKWRIYHMWAGSGSPATSLTFGRSPAWSPDGERLVYQGCNNEGAMCGLWVISIDGGIFTPLTDVLGDTMPAWSPDGQTLAFASQERSDSWDIYLLDLSSGAVQPLAASPARDSAPAWSPDGRQVAFLSNRDGALGIYAVDVTAGDAPRLIYSVLRDDSDWWDLRVSWRP